MDINKIFQSKIFYAVILSCLFLMIALLIFKAGTFVGARRAEFSCHWSENYQRNFGGPRPMPMGLGDRDFLPASGATGKILKIENSILTVQENNNTEKVILINNETTIRSQRETLTVGDLQTGDFIVVIGEPNSNGQIEAKLIRVMPVPQELNLNLAPRPQIP